MKAFLLLGLGIVNAALSLPVGCCTLRCFCAARERNPLLSIPCFFLSVSSLPQQKQEQSCLRQESANECLQTCQLIEAHQRPFKAISRHSQPITDIVHSRTFFVNFQVRIQGGCAVYFHTVCVSIHGWDIFQSSRTRFVQSRRDILFQLLCELSVRAQPRGQTCPAECHERMDYELVYPLVGSLSVAC